jgi:hypothetical protein
MIMQCLESLFTPPNVSEEDAEEYLSKFPATFYVQLITVSHLLVIYGNVLRHSMTFNQV